MAAACWIAEQARLASYETEDGRESEQESSGGTGDSREAPEQRVVTGGRRRLGRSAH